MVRSPMKSSFGAVVLAIAIAGTAGCGSSDNSDEPKKFAEFLGVWQFTAESNAVEECMGVAPDMFVMKGTNQFMNPGVSSDLVSIGLFTSTCNLKFAVAGKVATMTTDQKCDVGPADTTDFYAPASGTFTLNSATNAEESVVLMGKISFMSGATVTQLDCKLTVAGKLIKVAND
jgi:hypothetical protein